MKKTLLIIELTVLVINGKISVADAKNTYETESLFM